MLHRAAFPCLGGYRRTILLCAIIGLSAGCIGGSRGDRERAEVFGTVNFEGSPIRYGTINLIPDPQSNSPKSTLEIHNGSFTSSASRGILPGKYVVEIHGWTHSLDEMNSVDQLPGNQAPKQIIPEKYNKSSQLELTIDSGGRIEKNFDLK